MFDDEVWAVWARRTLKNAGVGEQNLTSRRNDDKSRKTARKPPKAKKVAPPGPKTPLITPTSIPSQSSQQSVRPSTPTTPACPRIPRSCIPRLSLPATPTGKPAPPPPATLKARQSYDRAKGTWVGPGVACARRRGGRRSWWTAEGQRRRRRRRGRLPGMGHGSLS